jgi:hypothetical protein
VDTETSRQDDQKNHAGILMAVAGVLALISAFRGVLRGRDLAAAFYSATVGMGVLGLALAQLGEAPATPTPLRIYTAIRVLIPASIAAISIWMLLR